MQCKDIIASVPVDIKLGIFAYVEDYRQLFRWKRVSKTWHSLIDSASLEPLYRLFISRNWPKALEEIKRISTLADYAPRSPNYGNILVTLGRNAADIRAGSLHEVASLVTPLRLGRTNFCYSGGFLAVYSIDQTPAAEKDVIYVYDLSILRTQTLGSETPARKVQCPGVVKCAAIANGRLAYLTQDPRDETSVCVGLQDLITSSTRICNSTVSDVDLATFASTLNNSGMNSYTNEGNEARPAATLQLQSSPKLFDTNGRFVFFSASFSTHYTVWDMNLDSETPITGSSFTLDKSWSQFLCEAWQDNPDFQSHLSLSYYMSVDERGDLYTTISGPIAEKGCVYPGDRFVLRYACTHDGKPIRMKACIPMPPYTNPELHDEQTVYKASRFSSFSGGGSQNFFAYSPVDMEYTEDSPYSTLLFGSVLDLRYPRIVIDRKQAKTRDVFDEFPPSGLIYDAEVEYSLDYLDKKSFYLLPNDEIWRSTIAATRIIPEPSKRCVIWHCLYQDEEVVTDGGELSLIRNVKIVGLKPTILPGEDASDEGFYIGGSDNMSMAETIDSTIPEPTSVCKITVEYTKNRKIKWAGDDQYIVLSHYRPRKRSNDDRRKGPDFESVFRLFRYGTASGDCMPSDPLSAV
ncbi:hypothetical protein TWF696_002195 [Orbilia brochopaga]|uniref:F-box domain-containing protein n=1 Tax=Orbilia brochopaga TaxID=3140254 RepID=A0AAV9U7T9_9PEZI